MSGVGGQLALIVALVLLNAAFAGTEMALVSLREAQLQRLEQQSKAGVTLARLARDLNQFLSTIQIGITLAGFLASATAAVSLAEPLRETLAFLGGAAEPVAVLIVTIVLAYVTLVFGELAPKRMAMQRAEKWGLVAARPLAVMSTITRPVVWLLSRSTNIAVRLMGGDPSRRREEVTEDELREMVEAHRSFDPDQRRIIAGAFEISERVVRDVMKPRTDVAVLDADATAEESLGVLLETGHSRAPVATGRDLDQVSSVVHMRDLVRAGAARTGDLGADPVIFPGSAAVIAALGELQRLHTQMAIVVDEHGGAVGMISVEDLVEEIGGESSDEADPDVSEAVRNPDGTITLAGGFPVHDLVDVGIHGVPKGRYTTVAGLVLDALGRLPREVRESVVVAGHTFEVTDFTDRSIEEVLVRPAVRRGPED